MPKCQECGGKGEVKEIKRTTTQSNALWLFFTQLSDSLNNAGYSQRDVFEKAKAFDVPVTKEFIHDLWIYFQKKMFGTSSTRDLKKADSQISDIHEVLMRNIGEVLGIEYIEFPQKCSSCSHIDCICLENMFDKRYEKEIH